MITNKPSNWDRIKGWLFHFFPHHLVSRLTLLGTRLEIPGIHHAINLFVRAFDVKLDEAADNDIKSYPNFNAFFTRALKADARPIDANPNSIVSPCDGVILQISNIKAGRIVQAKKQDYSVAELLTPQIGADFNKGLFCTIYLGPNHYHRVHMPFAGQLEAMIHVPGRLFSVAPYATQVIPRLYTKNERVISIFNTSHGRLAIVMVGAVNVSAIETAWHGLVSPRSHAISYHYYPGDTTHRHSEIVELDKGAEMGLFNLGSTVVLLIDNEALSWNPRYYPGSSVQVGCELASLISRDSAIKESGLNP